MLGVPAGQINIMQVFSTCCMLEAPLIFYLLTILQTHEVKCSKVICIFEGHSAVLSVVSKMATAVQFQKQNITARLDTLYFSQGDFKFGQLLTQQSVRHTHAVFGRHPGNVLLTILTIWSQHKISITHRKFAQSPKISAFIKKRQEHQKLISVADIALRCWLGSASICCFDNGVTTRVCCSIAASHSICSACLLLPPSCQLAAALLIIFLFIWRLLVLRRSRSRLPPFLTPFHPRLFMSPCFPVFLLYSVWFDCSVWRWLCSFARKPPKKVFTPGSLHLSNFPQSLNLFELAFESSIICLFTSLHFLIVCQRRATYCDGSPYESWASFQFVHPSAAGTNAVQFPITVCSVWWLNWNIPHYGHL